MAIDRRLDMWQLAIDARWTWIKTRPDPWQTRCYFHHRTHACTHMHGAGAAWRGAACTGCGACEGRILAIFTANLHVLRDPPLHYDCISDRIYSMYTHTFQYTPRSLTHLICPQYCSIYFYTYHGIDHCTHR